jgi:hypothetical protein
MWLVGDGFFPPPIQIQNIRGIPMSIPNPNEHEKLIPKLIPNKVWVFFVRFGYIYSGSIRDKFELYFNIFFV